MTAYVVDANILFSGLISRKPFYERLFGQYQFSTPDFALVELEKYRSIFLKKVKGNQADFEEFALLLFSRLTIVPDFLIRSECKQEAMDLCAPVDAKDSLYVALAIQLGQALVTRDIPLHDHLKLSGFDRVVLFDEFIRQTNAV